MSAVPTITVAIPFLDEERYLASAVRSILAQTMSDFELLLVDDGSRDRSLEIARSFEDPRVVVISDGRHVGLAGRLNEIARRARADIVARMDADDICHPTRFARQLELLRREGSDAVGTWAGLFGDEEGPFAVLESAPLPPSHRSALESGILSHATMLARRRWLLENPYDETLMRAEDRDLWCRTAKGSSFAVVPAPLYAVRVNAGTKTFVTNYAYAQRYNRRLILRHGPQAFGMGLTARAYLASWAKTGVFRAAARLGFAHRLVRRRGRPLHESERRLLEEALRSATVALDDVADLLENGVSS